MPGPDPREALTAALAHLLLTDQEIKRVVDAVLSVLAPALAAERERCAKHVEVLFLHPGDQILCGDTLDAAAAAIRALPPSAGDR